MSATRYSVAIVGGGIVGLATAFQLCHLSPGMRVVVLEKEREVGVHQTGHNSGVMHSGIYYRPGSQKAELCVAGRKALEGFCQQRGIDFQRCGKVVVATRPTELERLEELYRRGMANGVEGVELVGPERLGELEPYANGIKALYVPETGIVDFGEVVSRYASQVRELGGEILVEQGVRAIHPRSEEVVLETSRGEVAARYMVNCAGLHADRVARMAGVDVGIRIVPFRGEYYLLRQEKGHMVKGLIYPVPDPALPFLGVHFTRRVNGEVEAGPNAVLALAREGYRKADLGPGDMVSTFTYPGFWRMARRWWRVGVGEMYRSLRKAVFVRDLQRLMPAIKGEDLVPGGTGVRAQAVDRAGNLLADFCIQRTGNAIHVLNAPSPGATASLAIGKYVAELAVKDFGLADY